MKIDPRILTVSMLLIALPSAAQAQPGPTDNAASASGKVIGPANQPQAGVPVKIEGPPGETIAITDKSGTWSVYKLPAGEYKVKAISDQSTSAPVTFSVKEPSLWNKVTGGKDTAVNSPDIRVDRSAK